MKYEDIIEQCAFFGHEMLSTAIAALDGKQLPSYNELPEETRESIRMRAVFSLKFASAMEVHENYVATLTAHGWTYGETVDVEKKLNPSICDYDKLPVESRFLDEVFFHACRSAAFIFVDVIRAQDNTTVLN